MSLIKSTLRRLSELGRATELSREIEEELRSHIERRTQDNLDRGMPAEEAEADARRRFGDYEQVKALCLEVSRKKAAQNLKFYQGLTWVMLGVGLTLQITSEIHSVRQVGGALAWIAILWRVLIYLRSIQSTRCHREIVEPSILGLSEIVHAEPLETTDDRRTDRVAGFDSMGRTPVERVIAKDE